MTIPQRLNAISAAYLIIEQAQDDKTLLSGISGHYKGKSVSIDRERLKGDDMRAALDWFLDGGEFICYSKTEKPMFARKNSAKRQTTTWFSLRKGALTLQIHHMTKDENFSRSGWEALGANWVTRILADGEGPFGYHNGGALAYVKERAKVQEIPCPF